MWTPARRNSAESIASTAALMHEARTLTPVHPPVMSRAWPSGFYLEDSLAGLWLEDLAQPRG
jgi:hypothetical protein